MKAFFIFKDGKLVGNPIGYTTTQGAQKSLVGCEDWAKLLAPYSECNAKKDIPQEMIDSGIFRRSYDGECWLLEREKWTRKVWTPYLKEHYKIIEKEFDIVFKD